MGDEDARIASSLGMSAAAAGSLSCSRTLRACRCATASRAVTERVAKSAPRPIENARTLALCVLAARVGRVVLLCYLNERLRTIGNSSA